LEGDTRPRRLIGKGLGCGRFGACGVCSGFIGGGPVDVNHGWDEDSGPVARTKSMAALLLYETGVRWEAGWNEEGNDSRFWGACTSCVMMLLVPH